MARMRGNLEITDALGERYPNVIGNSIDPDAVPAILAGVNGFTDVAEVTPEPTNSVAPAYQWTGTTTEGVAVTIKLWEDPGYDPVALAERLRAEQGGV